MGSDALSPGPALAPWGRDLRPPGPFAWPGRRRAAAALAVAVGAPALARLLPPAEPELAGFLLLLAVGGAALLGRMTGALPTLALGWLVYDDDFVKPTHSLAVAGWADGLALAVFVLLGVSVALAAVQWQDRRWLLERTTASEFALAQTLGAIARSAAVAVFGSRLDGTITSWSPGAELTYGYAAAEAVGMNAAALAPPDRRAQLDDLIRRVAAGEEVRGLETERLRRDGSEASVWVDVVPIRDARGAVIGAASIHRDVSQWKQARDELGAAETRLRTLVESLPLVVYTTTSEPEPRALYVAPQVEELLGLQPEEARPERLQQMLHPDDRERVLAELARARDADAPLQLEYRLVRDDGAVVWIQDTSVVLPGEDGGPPRAQGYLLDIGERKRLEEQLRLSQKMEAVGRLAGGIAHDFNNLLTVIGGYGELALARGPDEAVRSDLLEIRRAVDSAAALTGKLLAFGRRQVFHSRVLDLNAVIDDTKSLILRVIGEDVEVSTRLDLRLGRTVADPSQVEQVLINLAVNARDAMPGGGKLTISTANAHLDEDAAQAIDGLEPGDYVCLAVADTGHGMDAETARHVFEPFFTTKPVGRGSGLGLSTVYGIVRQSGGNVTLYSEPGHGTLVRVYLPRSDEAATPAERPPAADAEPVAGDERILLVEDEPIVRDLVASMLERHGYRVVAAADPVEALDVAAADEGFDLLLTDVVMPTMDGRELARRLAGVQPGLRILYTSGYSADVFVERGLIDRGTLLLQKPFSSAELAEKVREALAHPAT